METETPAPPNDSEIRKIIETLASYVAKNGSQFEIMVREREKNNAQFFFLRGGDYNKYYTWCLANEQKKLVEPSQQNPGSLDPTASNNGINQATGAMASQSQAQMLPNAAPAYAYPPPNYASQPPSAPGAYPQQSIPGYQSQADVYGAVSSDPNQDYSVPPPQYPQYPPVPRFYPPPWAPPGMERPRMPPDYAQGPPGFGAFPPVRSRFSQGPPPPFGGPPPHMYAPPPNYPMPHPDRPFRPGFPPRLRPPFPGQGFHGEDAPEETLPPRPSVPERPWYELPAGIMMLFVRTEECSYKSLNPKTMVIPPPQLITEKSMRAIDAFYAPPTPSQPRNAEGWEKLGLYDFYRAKDAAKKALQRGEKVKQYKPGHSRSPSPRSRYSRSRSRSRSRSYSSRSRSRSRSRSSSRSRSRSRSKSPKRRSGSPAEKRSRRSRSRS